MNEFYTIDGKTLKNIEDLKNYLKKCDEENFNYHKIHFYNWLKDVFGDCKNAIKIKTAKNKIEALKRLK